MINSSTRARLARRIRLPLIGLALLALFSGSWTATATPNTAASTVASAVIRGCYYPSAPYVRILIGTQTGRTGEIAISWNQTGPAGPVPDAGSVFPSAPWLRPGNSGASQGAVLNDGYLR